MTLKLLSEYFSDNDYRKAVVLYDDDEKCSMNKYTIRFVDKFGSTSYTSTNTLDRAEELAEDYVL